MSERIGGPGRLEAGQGVVGAHVSQARRPKGYNYASIDYQHDLEPSGTENGGPRSRYPRWWTAER